MNQTTIFDVLYPKYKITKPIRLIELDNLEIIVCDNGDIFTTNKNKIRSNGRKDNRIENLEMVTLQQNIKHSIETGLKPKIKRDKYGRFAGKEVM